MSSWLREVGAKFRRSWIPAGRLTRSVNQTKDYLLGYKRFKYLPSASAPPMASKRQRAFVLGKPEGRRGNKEYVGAKTTLASRSIDAKVKKARSLNLMPALYHNLMDHKDKAISLSGHEVRGTNSGQITETSYKSQLKTNTTKAVRDVLKTAVRLTYQIDGGMQVQSDPAFQRPLDMVSCKNGGSYSFAQAIWHGNIGAAGSAANDGIYQYIWNIMGGAVSGTSSTNKQTSKLYFDNVVTQFNLANYSKESVIVDIYECVAKRDLFPCVALPGATCWSPVEAWYSGMLATQNPTNIIGANYGRINPTILDSKPWESNVFNVYWKIAASHRVLMAIGGGHVYTTTHNIDQLMDPIRWQNSAILAGITRNVMFVVRGTVGYNTVTASPDIAGATVQVKWQATYKAAQIQPSAMVSAYSTSSTSTGAQVSSVDEATVLNTNVR